MSVPSILLPLFVQVGLVMVLAGIMAARRLALVRSGSVRRSELSMGERAWPPPAQQASNAFSNQFELPVLFYVLVILALLTRKADLLFVVLSWAFVATRIVHAAVYVTSNDVPKRFTAFIAGAFLLSVMWIVFAIRILLAPLPA